MSQFQDVIVLWEFYFWKNKYKQKTKLSKVHILLTFILYYLQMRALQNKNKKKLFKLYNCNNNQQ